MAVERGGSLGAENRAPQQRVLWVQMSQGAPLLINRPGCAPFGGVLRSIVFLFLTSYTPDPHPTKIPPNRARLEQEQGLEVVLAIFTLGPDALSYKGGPNKIVCAFRPLLASNNATPFAKSEMTAGVFCLTL